jgi:hypothetical protein
MTKVFASPSESTLSLLSAINNRTKEITYMFFDRKFNLLVLFLFVLVCVAIQAQSPSLTSKSDHKELAQPLNTPAPVGCSYHCLWYSGDVNFAGNWNGLWNAALSDTGDTAQVWVPFVPSVGPYLTNAAQINSVTFNEQIAVEPNVTGMTFSFNTGMSAGNGGTVIYSGNCNYSAPVATGRSGDGYTEYAFTCVLPKTITLPSGSLFWVNITPTITGNRAAFLSDTLSPYPNRTGWGDYTNESFIYAPFYGVNYVNTSTEGSYLNEFSVGITGQYVQIY